MGQRMDNWDVSLESPVRSDSDDEQKSFLPSNGPGIESTVAGKEIKVKLAENDKKTARNDLRVLAIGKGTDLKFSKTAMGMIDNLIGIDENATIQNVDNFAAILEEVSKSTKRQILSEHGIKPEEGDKHDEATVYTVEQMSNWSPEEQAAADPDKITRSLAQTN